MNYFCPRQVCIQQVEGRRCSSHVILLSSLTGDANRDRAVKAGADAYVSKFNKKEILEALREALPGLALPIGAAS